MAIIKPKIGIEIHGYLAIGELLGRCSAEYKIAMPNPKSYQLSKLK